MNSFSLGIVILSISNKLVSITIQTGNKNNQLVYIIRLYVSNVKCQRSGNFSLVQEVYFNE